MAPDGGPQGGVVVGVEAVEQVGEGRGPGRATCGEHAATVGGDGDEHAASVDGVGRPLDQPAGRQPADEPGHRGLRDALGLGELRDAPRALAFEVGQCRGGHHAEPAARGEPRQQGDEPVELGGQLQAVDREHA